VHFHVLPRGAPGDAFAGARNDAIYPALEAAEAALAPPPGPLKMDNEERTPRSAEEMAAEARWLATFFDGEGGEQDEH
jgi:bis(5'-adenosyl)-triphosphatase